MLITKSSSELAVQHVTAKHFAIDAHASRRANMLWSIKRDIKRKAIHKPGTQDLSICNISNQVNKERYPIGT